MKMRIPAKATHSDAKKLELYRGRKARRVHLFVSDIEPQSKKMRESERIKFQDSLLRHMDRRGWQAFKGDIALDLRLVTTRRDAPQAHTIATSAKAAHDCPSNELSAGTPWEKWIGMPACDASTSMCSSKTEGEAVVIATSLADTLPRLSSSRAHRSASTTSARGSEHSSPRMLRGGCGSDGKSRPRKPASVDVTDRDLANVLLGRERDEERSPHGFDVDHILERHRTEQLGGEADALKRRVAQLLRQHRAAGQGVAHSCWSRLISAIRGELDARPSRSMSAAHARSRVCNAARTTPGKPRTSSSWANPPS